MCSHTHTETHGGRGRGKWREKRQDLGNRRPVSLGLGYWAVKVFGELDGIFFFCLNLGLVNLNKEKETSRPRASSKLDPVKP